MRILWGMEMVPGHATSGTTGPDGPGPRLVPRKVQVGAGPVLAGRRLDRLAGAARRAAVAGHGGDDLRVAVGDVGAAGHFGLDLGRPDVRDGCAVDRRRAVVVDDLHRRVTGVDRDITGDLDVRG